VAAGLFMGSSFVCGSGLQGGAGRAGVRAAHRGNARHRGCRYSGGRGGMAAL
jgi:hypothetical protein